MQIGLTVLRIGCGDIVDETTGELTPWSKAYLVNDSFIDTDMFTGVMDSSASIIDKTGNADVKLAEEIKMYLRHLESNNPVKLTFECDFVVSAKKQVLCIRGFNASEQKHPIPSISNVSTPAVEKNASKLPSAVQKAS